MRLPHESSPERDSPTEKMSLWARTQQLSSEAIRQVQNAYTHFPIEVRHHFASWIEEQPWQSIDENNPAHETYARQMLTILIEKLSEKAQNEQEFLNKLQFTTTAKSFNDMYGENPMNLVRVVKKCLETEERLVHMSEAQMTAPLSVSGQADHNSVAEIQRQLAVIDVKTDETDQDLRQMQMKQEKFVIDYQNSLKISSTLTQMESQQQTAGVIQQLNKLRNEKKQMEDQLLRAAQELLQQRIELAKKHKDTLTALDALQKRVVDDEIIIWKRSQQLAGNGAPFDNQRLDVLQQWCESLAELIWKDRQQIIKVDLLRQQLPIDIPNGIVDEQPELNRIVTGLLSSLVTSTFIVEQQPPQVLKKDSKFSATVRLLVGGKLNLQMTPPRVRATIISESQARSLLQEERHRQQCGNILNNEGTMDYHQQSGQLSITFRNMSLKNIQRADRRGAEPHTVAEEKFCILFSSDFNVGGNELKIQVWTLSLPVIVTVHGNQECQATATFIWDNQFSESCRKPFLVPDTVPWSEVGKMLSTKFMSMTGRGLSEGNLKYLATKIFGPTAGNQDPSQLMVTWSQFNKENLSGRNFTFWEWFWSVGKLVKEHLKLQWKDGLIIGFMEKTESQDLLMARPNGTFLLRFSDGTVGGITIAWVADSNDPNAERQVWNLAPFTIRDFAIRNLADRVKDLAALVTLFPDQPKDSVFSKYYSPASEVPPSANQGGYIKTTLINVIDPSLRQPNAVVMSIDNPATPQAFCPQSPDPGIAGAMSPASVDQSGIDPMDLENGMPIASPDYNNDDNCYDGLNEWLHNTPFTWDKK